MSWFRWVRWLNSWLHGIDGLAGLDSNICSTLSGWIQGAGVTWKDVCVKWDFYLQDYNGNRAVELGLEINIRLPAGFWSWSWTVVATREFQTAFAKELVSRLLVFVCCMCGAGVCEELMSLGGDCQRNKCCKFMVTVWIVINVGMLELIPIKMRCFNGI